MSVLLKRPIYIIYPAVNVSRLMLPIILAIIDFGIKHMLKLVVCHSLRRYFPPKSVIFCDFNIIIAYFSYRKKSVAYIPFIQNRVILDGRHRINKTIYLDTTT